MVYRFQYKKKQERPTASGLVHLLKVHEKGETYSLSDEEFELARLFDGTRSAEEVLDAFFKQHAVRVARADFDEFVSKLHAVGLFEGKEQAPPPQRDDSSPHASGARGEGWGRRRRGGIRQSEVQGIDKITDGLGDEVALGNSDGKNVDPDQGSSARKHVHEDEFELDDLEDLIPADGSNDRHLLPEGIDPHGQYAAALERGPVAGPPLIVEFPSYRWLLPVGDFLLLPLLHRSIMALVLLAGVGALFGVWFNRVDMGHDLKRLLNLLPFLQMMLLSMLTVNLFGQLTRAAAFRRFTGNTPRFGIILAFNIVPRFHAEIRGTRELPLASKRKLIGATLTWTLTLFVTSIYAWLALKGSSNFLPLFAVGIAVFSGTRTLYSLNPLAPREGYRLLVSKLGVPDLREQAFQSLLGKFKGSVPARGKALSKRSLILYGALSLAYIIAVLLFIVTVLGGWLKNNWGGLGVVVFIAIVLLMYWKPLSSARVTAPLRNLLVRWQSLLVRFRLQSWQRVILTISAIVVVGILPYSYEPGGEFKVLPDNRVDVRALIAADVREVFVQEGDMVQENQLIARLASDEERNNVAISKAKLDELRAQLNMAVKGATTEEIALARQKVKTARTRANFSAATAKRLEGLFAKQVVSQQEYENALSEASVNADQLLEAQRSLDLLLAGTRSEKIEAIRAEIARETAQLEYHAQMMQYTDVRAPASGRIVSGTLQYARGEYLKRGDLLAQIEDVHQVIVEVKVPEADITEVKVGAPVRLKAINMPHREFRGVVTNVAPTAEATDYGKVVRVLSKIPNDDGLLKAELTGYAKIMGSEMPVALAFTRMVRRFLEIELWSWLP